MRRNRARVHRAAHVQPEPGFRKSSACIQAGPLPCRRGSDRPNRPTN